MARRLLAFVLIACAASSGAASDGGAEFNEVAETLAATHLTAQDLQAITYVENMHTQLDRWAETLLVRLETGLAPKSCDPMLDGRAFFQVRKMQATYSAYPRSPALAQAIRLLAERHGQRLTELEAMLRYGADRDAFMAASAGVGEVIDAIRAARDNP